ncbi:MAG: hypothetical protein JNM91_10735, partial [Flavobacteriales bacterium]|nr:hypothetical protein [Flavobacteriales bacterium]
LFAELNGTPDGGGTWQAPGGGLSDGTFTPGVHVAGDYLYTVDGSAPCVDASAVVTVAVLSLPDPGLPGAATFCTDAAAQDLFTQLTGTPDAGGSWSAPDGTAHGDQFDPAADAPGIYTYTIAVPPPCVSVSSSVSISTQTPPDAGQPGSALLCITSPPIALFNNLTGSPDAGGTWTAPGGGAFDGTFTPGIDPPGTYTYTVAGIAPCADASSTVEVAVTAEPDPGTPGSITLCATDAATDLFAALGGTPDVGGTWTAPDGAAHSGSFDPATDAAGTYTYTIAVPAPCSSVSSTVTVSVTTPPDPGTDQSLTLCISGSVVDLFPVLGGSPDLGGTWTAPGGSAFDGSFDPAIDVAGGYIYTVAGAPPCPAANATITVDVTAEPDPGTDGLLTLCTSGAAAELFLSIGGTPDAGGAWTDPLGAPHSGMFDPAIDVAGIYTYTLAVPPPCSSVSTTVTVSLVSPPDAGTDATTTVCISGASINLFSLLGGSADVGGTWSAPDASAADGTFLPGTDVGGLYTYT